MNDVQLAESLEEAARVVIDLRRRLDEASAWLEALGVERDHRVIQARAR